MATHDFPIYLAEINCELLHAFRFTVPEQEIGRDDVIILVEYGDEEDGVVPYCVWAQFRGKNIRAFYVRDPLPARAIPEISFKRLFSALIPARSSTPDCMNFSRILAKSF